MSSKLTGCSLNVENLAIIETKFSNSKQKINEQKLQAFDIGAMGKRPLSRREQEERRKREEETAAAHVRIEITTVKGWLTKKSQFFYFL